MIEVTAFMKSLVSGLSISPHSVVAMCAMGAVAYLGIHADNAALSQGLIAFIYVAYAFATTKKRIRPQISKGRKAVKQIKRPPKTLTEL